MAESLQPIAGHGPREDPILSLLGLQSERVASTLLLHDADTVADVEPGVTVEASGEGHEVAAAKLAAEAEAENEQATEDQKSESSGTLSGPTAPRREKAVKNIDGSCL